MAGSAWEWSRDDYDASAPESPVGVRDGDEQHREHVLRGGSWSDCADALCVNFRSSSAAGATHNIGFRLVRLPKAP